MNLNIVPIEYDKRGLEQIIHVIHNALPVFFENFVIKKQVDFSTYKEALSYNYDKRLVYFLNKDLINLLNKFEKPVIGITSHAVVKNKEHMDDSYYSLGFGTARGISFVSTYPLSLHSSPSNSENHLTRVGIECIHELGHVFGLEHHKNCREIPAANSLCPMEIGHRIFIEQRKINTLQYVDARRTKFCSECYSELEKNNSKNIFF